ncbi:hypothetical protein B0H14DRAFT_3646280 [Mycena olivaceomarginata]|nr:hypothetical protein B0H14DRAFT_3646280 [Mycena olivaceomarginata]
MEGQWDIARFLSENGADWGPVMLHVAKQGRLEFLPFAIQCGADVNVKYGEPLRVAAEHGHLDIVRFLVENGADVNSDCMCFMANLCAWQQGTDIVRFLVENGADVNSDCILLTSFSIIVCNAHLSMFDEYEDDEEYQEYMRDQEHFHNQEDDLQDDAPREESEYHHGQGINYVVKFDPQLPPLKPGEKRRANARVEKLKRSIYVHEKAEFPEVLNTAIAAVGRNGRNDQSMHYKIVATELRTTRFKVTWTIACSDYQGMELATENDFKEMVKKVIDTPRVTVTLELKELPLESEPPSTSVTENAVDRNANGNAEKSGSRKRKTTAEEEEMAETIAQLHSAHHCSDRTCSSHYCSTGNPNAKHVRLTPFLLNFWASAILAKMDGVDIHTPPPPEKEKAFWPVSNQPEAADDISLLASRRLANSSKPNSSSVVINNDFARLAAILALILSANVMAAPSTPSNDLNHWNLPDRMSLNASKTPSLISI